MAKSKGRDAVPPFTRLSVYITEDQDRILSAVAERRAIARSELMRRILDAWIDVGDNRLIEDVLSECPVTVDESVEVEDSEPESDDETL